MVGILAIGFLVYDAAVSYPKKTSQSIAGRVYITVPVEPCTDVNCYCKDGFPSPVTVNCPGGIIPKHRVKPRFTPYSIPVASGSNAQSYSGGTAATELISMTYGGPKPYNAYYGLQDPYANVNIDTKKVTSITCKPASSIGTFKWSVCLNQGESRDAVCAAAAKVKAECTDLISKVQDAINSCVKWAKAICGIVD